MSSLISLRVGSRAETLKTANPDSGTIAVDGEWLFHTGDNLAWAIGHYGFDTRFLLDTLFSMVLLFTIARRQLELGRRRAEIESELRSVRETVEQVADTAAPSANKTTSLFSRSSAPMLRLSRSPVFR